MSKKKQIVFMVGGFAVFYFILFVNLIPMDVVETEEAYFFMFYIKIAYIAVAASSVSSITLFWILHKDFLQPYLGNFRRFQPLLWQLVKRDFVTKYKRSVLGVLWSLLSPLMTMIVMTIVFSHLFRFDIPNFPVYLLGGQIIFNLFSESTTTAMGSVIGGASMIKKVYIPKYVFPLSRVMSSLVNFFFSFIAFLLVFFITGAPKYMTFFLFFIPVLYTLIFSLGIGLLLSSIAVFFRDTIYLYGVLITALTFLTPLFYPVSILPKSVLQVVGFNPLYHFVDYFRSVALYGTIPGAWENIVCLSFALVALLVGGLVFLKQQDKYILQL